MAAIQSERAKKLDAIAPEDIIKEYKDGRITKAEYHQLLVMKANRWREESFKTDGMAMTMLHETIKEFNAGWENFVDITHAANKIVVPTKGTDVPALAISGAKTAFNAAYYAGETVFGLARMALAPFNAISNATGQKVEDIALANGATPATAKIIGTVAGLSIGMTLPVGMAAKGFVKGVQTGAKVLGVGQAAAKAGEQLPLAINEAEKFKQIVLSEGLKAEGVADAAKTVNKMAESVGKPATLTETAVEAATKTGVSAKGATLPRELAGALPKYRDFTPQFTSDIDKALYIVAQETKSAADAKYMEWLRNIYPDLTETQIRSFGRQVRFSMRDIAKTATTEMSVPETGRHLIQQFELRQLAKEVVTNPEAGNAFLRKAVEVFTGDIPGDRVRFNKQFMDMLTQVSPEDMARGDIGAALRVFASDIAATPASKMGDFTKIATNAFKESQGETLGMNYMGANAFYKFRELYINSLLTTAWAPSVLGNLAALGNNVGERALGALFSVDRTSGLVMKEPFYQVRGMTLAIGDAIKSFGSAYREMDLRTMANVLNTDIATIRKMSQGDLFKALQRAGVNPTNLLGNSRLDFFPGEFSGAVGRIVRAPGDTVRGVDNLFKTLFVRGSYYADAIREAERNPQAVANAGGLGQFIAKTVANPTEEMITRAREMALIGTYQNDLGQLAHSIQKGAQAGPFFMYFPFMKTPINLFKYSWNRTPVLQLISSSLYRDILTGGEAADMAIGRLTLSNLKAMFYYEMAKAGKLTGGGPADPTLKQSWRLTHEPYSIKTETGWVPLANMEPENTPAGMIADLVEVADQLDEATFMQSMSAVILAGTRMFTSNGWFTNGEHVMDAINGIKEGQGVDAATRDFLLAPVTNTLAMAKGGAALATRTRQIIDPMIPETRAAYIDRVRANVPGWSPQVPAQRDGLGNIKVPPQWWGSNWFGYMSPMVPKIKPNTEDPVALEASRLGVDLPTFPFAIGGKVPEDFKPYEPQPGVTIPTPIDGAQHDRWMAIYRNLVYHKESGIEAALLKYPGYQDMTETSKRIVFQSLLQGYKNAAQAALLIEDPPLAKEMIGNIRTKVMPMLPPDQRPQAEQQFSDAISSFEDMTAAQKENLLRWGVLDGNYTYGHTTPLQEGQIPPAVKMPRAEFMQRLTNVPVNKPGESPVPSVGGGPEPGMSVDLTRSQ